MQDSPIVLCRAYEGGGDEEIQDQRHGINESRDKGRCHNRGIKANALCRDGQKRACELGDYDGGKECQRHGDGYGKGYLGILHQQSVHEKHLGKGDRSEDRTGHKSAKSFL